MQLLLFDELLSPILVVDFGLLPLILLFILLFTTINITTVMEHKGLMHTITLHSKYNDGSEHSFLCRITPDLEFAKKLMQSIYNDAAKRRETRVGTYSDPMWKDDEHHILEVKHTMYVGCMIFVTIETYYLGYSYDKNYLSDKPWIID